MRRRRRRPSWDLLSTTGRVLLLLLAVGSALVALLHGIDPLWLEHSIQWVRSLLTLSGN